MLKFKALIKHSQGQLSIFLGMSLIILMTLLAFMVNVGLYVKAKINLQNAVDSAAWAGAAVQAKQLTNIAYLNWEMRNTYKEWMFKYYVLGQASLTKTRLTDGYGISNLQPLGSNMSFRADAIFKTADQFAFDKDAYSKYNLPSICFHFGKTGTEFNICEAALVPGLPRFDPISIPGISEHQEVFLNSIVKTKARNCSERTNLNFGVALMWAYGVGDVIIPGAPGVASTRPGAWPKAFELAVRMRNLETFVNRPAITTGICTSGKCSVNATDLDQQYTTMPFNERPIKAFFSAYRNLNQDMQEEFTLYEIPPNPFVPNPNTLSTFLIPASSNIAGVSAQSKQYVDLQAYPLNLVTYFSTFASTTGKMDAGAIEAEASCMRSNTAIPVPGYLFGFIKNPEVLTYYAVKGKTKYIGLLNPFQDSEGLELSAYAAAKPFGGRIGPRLFHIDSNTQVRPRRSSRQFRSLPYVTGIRPGGPPQGIWPDAIVPLKKPGGSNFFVSSDNDVIGGIPDTGDNLTFAIPNLLYEYQESYNEIGNNQTRYSSPVSGTDTVQIVTHASSIEDAKTIHEFAGLYDKTQYMMFAANIPPLGQETIISADSVNEAIYNVRRPTKYEALNYLIPTCASENDKSDSAPVIDKDCNKHTLFAPFFGPNALHKNSNDLLEAVEAYIQQNDEAISTFIAGLQKMADDIRNSITNNKHDGMNEAASLIYKAPAADTDCARLSMAGKFRIFFKSSSATCGIIPLRLSLERHWSDKASNDPNFSNYFTDHYRPPTGIVIPPAGQKSTEYHTAYLPGTRQGAAADGEVSSSNKLRSNSANVFSRRNYYSVKLIPMAMLTKNGSGNFPSYADQGFYQESSDIGNLMPDIYPQGAPDFKNPITTEDLSEFGELTH